MITAKITRVMTATTNIAVTNTITITIMATRLSHQRRLRSIAYLVV